MEKDGTTDSIRPVGTTTATWMDNTRSPFHNRQPPDIPYATPLHWGVNQFATADDDPAHLMDDAHEEEEEASLGRQIVSPRNVDQWRQAFSEKISPLDIACLGNACYHGGTKGCNPLTVSIVHRCG